MLAFVSYGGVFALIVSVIAVGYQPPQPSSNAASAVSVATPSTSVVEGKEVLPANKIVAVNVAGNLAEQTNMLVAGNLAEQRTSLSVEFELAQTDNTAIIKPQIIQPTVGNTEITTYVTKEGDTASSIANAHELKVETIRWANNLTGDAIAVGRTLTIPPTDGVIYTVRSNDTLESLANTYSTTKERITALNNLEISGLNSGQKIIIPGGILPANQRPGYVAPIPTYSTGFISGYGSWSGTVLRMWYEITPSNGGYAAGNCTVYAFNRRAAMGRPIPMNLGNASTWATLAARQGYTVNNRPSAGAVIQSGNHVGIVEEILPNGDIRITDMNFGYVQHRVAERILPASTTGNYRYIH